MPDIAAVIKQIPPYLYRPAPIEIRQVQEGDIRIEYRYQEADLEKRTGRFWGGVRAFYGPSVLECDELEVDYGAQKGRANGQVKVTDPDGTIVAERLVFDWGKRTGEAEHALVQIGEVTLLAERIDVQPGQWTAYGVKGTASKAKTPDVSFEAAMVVLQPGRKGTAHRMSAVVFGHKLGTLPTYGFTLARKATGMGLIVPGYRPGGFMISASGSAELNEKAFISAKGRVYQDRPARLQAQMAYSLSGATSEWRHTPRSDIAERFADGWFDSSVVRDPKDEFTQLSQRSQVVSLGTAYSVGTRGRLQDAEQLAKPVEITYEATGMVGPLAGLVQTKFQRIDPGGAFDSVNRNMTTMALRSDEIPLFDKATLSFGADGSVYASSHQTYAWARAMGYVILRPHERLRLGLGGAWGFETGEAHYAFDRNYTDRAYHVRADVDLGNVNFIALFKYDGRRHQWFDHEFALSFIAGSFEPFIRYRHFPEEFSVGASLRISDFVDVLRKRSLRPRSK